MRPTCHTSLHTCTTERHNCKTINSHGQPQHDVVSSWWRIKYKPKTTKPWSQLNPNRGQALKSAFRAMRSLHIEKVIDIWSTIIIGRYCGATKITKALSVTANCSLVLVYTCTRYLEWHSQHHEMTVQACPKIMNVRTIVCIFGQSLPLWSEQSSCSTLVL